MTKFQRVIFTFTVFGIIILFAYGFGQASGENAATRRANAHPHTVTKTIEHTATVTKTVTVDKPYMPDSCLKLTDINLDAYKAFATFSSAYGVVPNLIDEAFLAIGKQDAQGLQDVKTKLRPADEAASLALDTIIQDVAKLKKLAPLCSKELTK